MPNTQIKTMSGRTLEEVKAGIRMRMRNMVYNALEIGNDLIEAKDACEHGQWLPFLRDIGFSASTAANYMRIAREVGADSRMAQLPYTKILALLAAPPEEREELAAAAEDMSAAEIRRLTEERNKAAEAANIESCRAEQAEREAKEYYDEIAHLKTKIQGLEVEAEKAYQRGHDAAADTNLTLTKRIDKLREEKAELEEKAERLRADLLSAENNRVEVEKIPEDYQSMKDELAEARRNAQELMDAAAEAEERASAAEAELEEARAENAQNGTSEYEKMHFAMKTFLMQCELMAVRPDRLMRDAEKVLRDVERLRIWCEAITTALANVQTAEGAVI